MHVFVVSLFLFGLALLIAIVEIEAEGKYGWAEKMPTWYRTTGWFAKFYRAMIHKPLTGYHLALAPFTAGIFIYPMVANSNLTWAGVFIAAGQWFVWVTVWDFAWFVLNPSYGIKRFDPDEVWWFADERWIGPVPQGYILNLMYSVLFVSIGAVFEGGWDNSGPTIDQLQQIGWYLLGIGILIAVAPLFHRYYKTMRRTDDRDKVDIFHRGEA